MKFKSLIMGTHKNLRTNMTIYKALNPDGDFGDDKNPTNPQQGPAVVMVEGGATGQFNRANRSLTHFTEFAPAIVVLFLVVKDVFPCGAFICAVVYTYGRVIHQTGEAGARTAAFISCHAVSSEYLSE